MVLTIQNICQYLLENKLIELKSIIEGDLLVRDASSRNTNFLINQFSENGLKVLIKQPDITDEDYVQAMKVEAEIYRMIDTDVNFEHIRQYLPHYKSYDDQNHILIMEQLTGVCRIFDYLFHGRNIPDENMMEQFADSLAALHNIPLEKTASYAIQKSYPWFLDIGLNSYRKHIKETDEVAYNLLFEILENEKWMQQLRETRRMWQKKNIIHLDLRFTNWMIPFRHETNAKNPIWLIDWEMAGRGDDAWDIAFFMGEWISLGMFFKENHPTIHLYIEQIIPKQINGFLKIYLEKRNFSIENKNKFLKRLRRYLPIKILLIAYEMAVDFAEDGETPQFHIEAFKFMMQNPLQIKKKYFYSL